MSKLKETVEVNKIILTQEIDELKEKLGELKTIIDDVPVRFEKIKEKFNDLFGKVNKLMEFQKQYKIDQDDLKLRICVLEDALKEHSHFSPRGIVGISDIALGNIPSRKK